MPQVSIQERRNGCNVFYEIIYEFSGSGMTEMSLKDFPEPLPRSFFNS